MNRTELKKVIKNQVRLQLKEWNVPAYIFRPATKKELPDALKYHGDSVQVAHGHSVTVWYCPTEQSAYLDMPNAKYFYEVVAENEAEAMSVLQSYDRARVDDDMDVNNRFLKKPNKLKESLKKGETVQYDSRKHGIIVGKLVDVKDGIATVINLRTKKGDKLTGKFGTGGRHIDVKLLRPLGENKFKVKKYFLKEETYLVAGRPVTLNKGKTTTGVDWTVTFKNGKTVPLADVLALIKPLPNLTKESKLNEKSVSKSQQQAAGIALAAKRGDIPKSKLKGASKEMAKMKTTDLEDFAKTKHYGLPDKKEGVNEAIDQNVLINNITKMAPFVKLDQDKKTMTIDLDNVTKIKPATKVFMNGLKNKFGYEVIVEGKESIGEAWVVRYSNHPGPGKEEKGKKYSSAGAAYTDKKDAEKFAVQLKKDGWRVMMYQANIKGMSEQVNEEKPCWDGYKQYGMKKKNGKEVPNCVPESVNESAAPIKDLLKKMPDHVKGWAKYVAQHKNGEWWYYDSVPKLVPNVGWKSWDREGYQFGSNVKTDASGWESSQQKLKEGVNEGVRFEKKLKNGNIFQVIDRDTRGMRGTQDKFQMQIVDKNGKVVKNLGSHPSAKGAEKFGARFESRKKVNEEKPCWDGYKQYGMKKKNGKEVPNCVPESVNEAWVVRYTNHPGPGKEEKGKKYSSAGAAYTDKKDAEKFAAQLKKDGWRVLIYQSKVRGMDEK